MAWFSVLVQGLPNISLNVFNLRAIRDSIVSVLVDISLFGNKIPVNMFTSNDNYKMDDNIKNNLNICQDKQGPRRYLRRPSAGVIGLHFAEDRGMNNNSKHSLGNVLRCRFLWYS
jgi:hypothetical protein